MNNVGPFFEPCQAVLRPVEDSRHGQGVEVLAPAEQPEVGLSQVIGPCVEPDTVVGEGHLGPLHLFTDPAVIVHADLSVGLIHVYVRGSDVVVAVGLLQTQGPWLVDPPRSLQAV